MASAYVLKIYIHKEQKYADKQLTIIIIYISTRAVTGRSIHLPLKHSDSNCWTCRYRLCLISIDK